MHFTASTLLVAQSLATTCLGAALPARAPAVPVKRDDGKVLLRAVTKRAAVAASGLKPATAIALAYSSAAKSSGAATALLGASAVADTTDDSTATVLGTMKLPAIVLESIASVSGVACTAAGNITVPFSSATDFATAKSSWPQTGAIMITTSAGNCAPDGERGVYVMNGVTFDDAKSTAIVAGKNSTLADQLQEAEVDFKTTTTSLAARKNRRGLDIDLNAGVQGKTIVSSDSVTVVANNAAYTGDIKLSGKLKFDFLKLKLSTMTVDLDYNSVLDMNLTTTVNTEQTVKSFDYTPLDFSESAFTIPGVLDVGPLVSVALGVEIGVAGTVTVNTDVNTAFTGSNVHIDFLDTSKSTATNWKPVTTSGIDVSAELSVLVSPYASLDVGMGIQAFNKLVDLTAKVEAKASLVNSLNFATDFSKSSGTNITFTPPSDTTKCPNGAWFASALDFGITASIASLEADLYDTELPIYESQCWNPAGLGKTKRATIAAY